jgi:hypothetical protein
MQTNQRVGARRGPMTGSAKQDCFEQEVDRRRVLTIAASDAIVHRHTEQAGLRRLE